MIKTFVILVTNSYHLPLGLSFFHTSSGNWESIHPRQILSQSWSKPLSWIVILNWITSYFTIHNFHLSDLMVLN